MKQKTASIIVPCYNVEQYLPRCLDSLVNQTLNDIEIICINDGSPDRCIDILREYENRHPDTVVVIDKKNEGVWRGRFDAIAIARGEYIGFVDSDDFVEPNFAANLYQTAKEFDADISVCGFKRIDVQTGKILTTEMIEERPPFDIGAEPQRLLELNGAPWNKFFRADLLKQLHDFENPPKIFDDMMLHLLAFPHATRVAYCPDALVNYIIRNDSIMTTIDKSKLDSAYQAMLEVKSVYQDECPQLIPLLDAAAFLHMGTSLMFRISYDRQANLSEELSKNRIYLNDNFPSWSSDSIISSTNAKRYGGALKKLYLARRVYSIGLMRPALSLYRFMIHTLHIDIKW